MARISGRIRIAAPVERVFDTAADSLDFRAYAAEPSQASLTAWISAGVGLKG
jgi:hypothetical protein